MLLLAAALALTPAALADETPGPVQMDVGQFERSRRLRKAGAITGAVGGGLVATGVGVAVASDGWGALGALVLLGGAGTATAAVGEGLFLGGSIGGAQATGSGAGWGNAAAITYGVGLGGGILLNQAAALRSRNSVSVDDPVVRAMSITGTSMVGTALVVPWFLAHVQHERNQTAAVGTARLDLRVVPTARGVAVAGSF